MQIGRSHFEQRTKNKIRKFVKNLFNDCMLHIQITDIIFLFWQLL